MDGAIGLEILQRDNGRRYGSAIHIRRHTHRALNLSIHIQHIEGGIDLAALEEDSRTAIEAGDIGAIGEEVVLAGLLQIDQRLLTLAGVVKRCEHLQGV